MRRRPPVRRRTERTPGQGAPAAEWLVLRASLSAQAKERLLAFMARGSGAFILTSVDGSISIRAHIEHADARATPEFRYGKLTVDWSRGAISTASGQAILSKTELRLLGALLEGGREVVTREELSRRVWPHAHTDARGCAALPVYIHALRRRLTSIGAGSALQTERGVGYRLRV